MMLPHGDVADDSEAGPAASGSVVRVQSGGNLQSSASSTKCFFYMCTDVEEEKQSGRGAYPGAVATAGAVMLLPLLYVSLSL